MEPITGIGKRLTAHVRVRMTNRACARAHASLDNAIPVGVRVWVRLVEDRFGVSLYPEKTSALSAADVAADVPPAFFCSAVEK